MQKLVSRNPVLRFKEGRKLLKALGGVKTSAPVNETIGRYVREKNRSMFGSGWRWYDTKAPVGRDHVALNLEIEQDGWILKPNGTKVRASLRNNTLQATPAVKNAAPAQPGSGSTKAGMKAAYRVSHPTPAVKNAAPARLPVLTNLFNFGGVQKGWRGTQGTLGEDVLSKLRETGFTGSTAKEAQEYLNKNFRSVGLFGNISADNKWGAQSQRGLDAFYNAWKENQALKVPISPTQTPEFLEELRLQFIAKETPQLQIDRAVANANFKTQVGPDGNLLFAHVGNYNRSGVRERMRLLGYNPYLFTGDLRKALRLYWNGLITSLPEELKAFTNTYKKGGKALPSRNPITRFKVTKGQQGLKTAPKAKDRYTGGRKYSTPNQNGDHVDVVVGQKPGFFTHVPTFSRIISPTAEDTTYVEIPEHTSFVDVKPRIVRNNWYEDENGNKVYNNSPEFNIMKRRFNLALLAAPNGKLTPLQPRPYRPITYLK